METVHIILAAFNWGHDISPQPVTSVTPDLSPFSRWKVSHLSLLRCRPRHIFTLSPLSPWKLLHLSHATCRRGCFWIFLLSKYDRFSGWKVKEKPDLALPPGERFGLRRKVCLVRGRQVFQYERLSRKGIEELNLVWAFWEKNSLAPNKTGLSAIWEIDLWCFPFQQRAK